MAISVTAICYKLVICLLTLCKLFFFFLTYGSYNFCFVLRSNLPFPLWFPPLFLC